MNRESVNKSVLLILAIFISAIFLSMIRSFLMAIFLAGIFAALARPMYRRFAAWYGGRRALASLSTLLVIVVVVILPLGLLMGIVTAQAIKVGQTVTPWVQQQIAELSDHRAEHKSRRRHDRTHQQIDFLKHSIKFTLN